MDVPGKSILFTYSHSPTRRGVPKLDELVIKKGKSTTMTCLIHHNCLFIYHSTNCLCCARRRWKLGFYRRGLTFGETYRLLLNYAIMVDMILFNVINMKAIYYHRSRPR